MRFAFPPYGLRQTFVSHLVMKGVGLKAVQELLGHADIKMTMRYAHLSQAHLIPSCSLPPINDPIEACGGGDQFSVVFQGD
jgi:hypothetical protein